MLLTGLQPCCTSSASVLCVVGQLCILVHVLHHRTARVHPHVRPRLHVSDRRLQADHQRQQRPDGPGSSRPCQRLPSRGMTLCVCEGRQAGRPLAGARILQQCRRFRRLQQRHLCIVVYLCCVVLLWVSMFSAQGCVALLNRQDVLALYLARERMILSSSIGCIQAAYGVHVGIRCPCTISCVTERHPGQGRQRAKPLYRHPVSVVEGLCMLFSLRFL